MFRTHKKDQYALRAIFELAKHRGTGPRKISEIARAQIIPLRFLEVILNNLKGSGLVDSKRGSYGGYHLLRPADEITVGDVFRYVQGTSDQSQCTACISKKECPLIEKCAFKYMWTDIKNAVFKIYDETTIQDLLDNERQMSQTITEQ